MKSPAKLNIFLKIVGTRGEYHEICSRFIRFEQIFDEVFFEKADKFTVECNQYGQNLAIENNIILKAFRMLELAGFKNELKEFFKIHKVVINKNIPIGAGLGGGSSNAATFLLMANDILNLKITTQNLIQIGAQIGADVPFFISGAMAANVSGIGEVIKEFDDNLPTIEVFTPEIVCSTPAVYGEFRKNFMQNINVAQANEMAKLTSKILLERYKNSELNDLYEPCFALYKPMKVYKNMFLSGSGSSLFFLK